MPLKRQGNKLKDMLHAQTNKFEDAFVSGDCEVCVYLCHSDCSTSL